MSKQKAHVFKDDSDDDTDMPQRQMVTSLTDGGFVSSADSKISSKPLVIPMRNKDSVWNRPKASIPLPKDIDKEVMEETERQLNEMIESHKRGSEGLENRPLTLQEEAMEKLSRGFLSRRLLNLY